MLVEKTVQDFSRELASNSPAPGGGSVSALAGSLSSALVAMVCNLTVGKEKYKEHEEELKEVLSVAEALKKQLLETVDKDTAAFNEVMASFKMPKDTEEQKAERSKAIQKAFINAAELPLEAAKCCLKIMECSEKVIEKGNSNAASDAGVAVLMAGAGARGAALNVEINLGSIKDEEKKKQLSKNLNEVIQQISEKEQSILIKVRDKM